MKNYNQDVTHYFKDMICKFEADVQVTLQKYEDKELNQEFLNEIKTMIKNNYKSLSKDIDKLWNLRNGLISGKYKIVMKDGD